MTRIKTFISLLLILSFLSSNAQDGKYDLRFVQIEDAQSNVALIDIEIKAHSLVEEFYLADQNFRFSFDEAAVLPYTTGNPSIIIAEELDISGLNGQSLYGTHNLNGSLGSVISYNLELLSGEGILLNADEWTKVGRLAFELLNPNAELGLTWHKIEDFPPTYISEKTNGTLSRADEGEYYHTEMSVDIANPLSVDNSVSIFPNPANLNSPLTVTLNAKTTHNDGAIILNDALSRTVAQQSINIVEGTQNYEFIPEGLSAGTYWLSIVTESWQSVAQPIIIGMSE